MTLKQDSPIFLLQGPYGFYVQLGENGEDGKKPKRVSLPKQMQPENVDLEVALDLLALPRLLGQEPESGDNIYAAIGRYGPYVRRGKTYKSLTKDDDVLTIELDRALTLLSQAKSSAPSVLKELGEHPDDGEKITLNSGRYGPYVKHKKTNASLPKDMEPDSVTLEIALDLLAKKKKGGKKTRKRKTKKK